jgi:hypothetical protein
MTRQNHASNGGCKKCANKRSREWYAKNKALVRKRDKKRSKTVLGKYVRLKAASKFRGLSMTLSFEEFAIISSKPCYYCGGKLSNSSYGLDQIISGKGYTKSNVRPCCMVCNRAKNVDSCNKFKNWVKKIYKYWVEDNRGNKTKSRQKHNS